MFIDSHAHLSDSRLACIEDELFDSFAQNGIDSVIEVGCDLPSSESAVKLAARRDNVYATVGFHPCEADTFTEEMLAALERLTAGYKVVALGEIGLDYHYDYDKDRQKELFVRQLKIADKAGLPVIIHLRDAYGDMAELLEEYKSLINHGILFHCYSGSREMVDRFRYLDPYYAFGGAITFKKNNRAEVVQSIPRDRLMLETDCPYMSPEPKRGEINTPNNIPIIASRMAEILGIGVQEVGEMTSRNTRRFFSIEG